MAQLVGVHGMANHQLGRHQLLTTWTPALADGLERATGHRVLNPPGLDLSFYGDLFLPTVDMARNETTGPAGTKGAHDADEPWHELAGEDLAELVEAMREAVTPEEIDAAECAPTKGYSRVPRGLQAILRAIDRRFGAAAGVLHLGVLRQVRRYLRDPQLKAEVHARVSATITEDCRMLIGHSLGSVVAYEFLHQHPHPHLRLLLTVGSPLGLRMVRSRITMAPLPGVAWVNIRDRRDPVACAGSLHRWWPAVDEAVVDNGSDAHAAERYLSKQATGRTMLRALPELAP